MNKRKNLWLVEFYCNGKWGRTNVICFTRKNARQFCKTVLGNSKCRYKKYIPAE